jgi:RNA polymerase sigma factor (sigma-70 family)
VNRLTDQQLLRAYTEGRSEPAFAELVRRHVNLVYSAARRMVGDAHLAEDVAQGVFLALARSANQLAERPVLSGWLHRTARNIAAQTVRADVRRRAREREATAMNEPPADKPEASWEPIAPLLEAALGELSEPDRDALLLRYFERKSAREAAEILHLSEEAAQKRVNRAVARLRDLFAKRGVTVGAGALIALLSANAVQAAPASLAGAITAAAALAGTVNTALTTATTATTAKAIAMTTLQKALVATALAVVAGTGIHQARLNIRLRERVQSLEQRQDPLTEQVRQLRQERDDATNQLAALREDNERLNRGAAELLKLRGQLSSLRRAEGAVAAADPPRSASEPAVGKEPPPEDLGRELGRAVVRGESAALQRVRELSKAEHDSFNTNSAGLNDTLRGELSARTFAPLQAAFDVIAEAAAQGSQAALDAVAQSAQVPELKGMAIQALGTLAGQGNTNALDILLDHDKYGFLLSNMVGALRPAAENGNQKAIEALAAVASDSSQQALWYMAASGLSPAAEAGNPLAVDSLIALSGSTNAGVQSAALAGLRQAAANQNAKAAEALRAAGLR